MKNASPITLPAKAEMRRRLKEVCTDKHLHKYFFPLVLPLAGQQLGGKDVAKGLTSAAVEYVMKTPAPLEVELLRSLLPPMLEALIDDKAVLADAVTFLRRIKA